MNALTTTKNNLARADHNAAAMYLVGLSETGRYTMAQALNTIANLLSDGSATSENFPWHGLRFQHVTALRAKLESAGYKPATINKMLAAIRGTIRAAWLDGQLSAEDYQKAVSVKSVKSSELPAGRELQSGELSALLEACENDTGTAGTRDAAIIALMYSCGLRRDEVIKLELSSYEPDTGKMTVKGKGKKERVSWLTGGAALALADWLKLRGDNPGGLFVPINKGGRITTYERMTSKAIYNMLQKRADEAGVKHFSPHDLRRTFVSDLLDAGADLATVSKMAGHANVQTTARYDRRPEEAKRKAAGLLHVPYRGRVAQ
jgi:site-specific recombinase XerD